MTREDGTRCRVSCILPVYNGDVNVRIGVAPSIERSTDTTGIDRGFLIS